MFSGIIEAQSKIKKIQDNQNAETKVIRIFIERPASFDDLKIGDSICVNGVCLTVEYFDETDIQFCMGTETISILTESFSQWKNLNLNLERSLRFGDRVHGHLVTGHVDGLGKIVSSIKDGDCWQLKINVPSNMSKYLWKKGSVCLNGVSLTVNEVEGSEISLCLIPETIAATNLSSIPKNHFVNLEVDYLSKAYFHSKEVFS